MNSQMGRLPECPQSAEATDQRLITYTLVTPSHEILLNEWFLRTLPTDCRPHLHFVDADPVDFGTRHWHRVVAHKFDILEQAFATLPPETIFVLSDVDIRFYRPFADEVRSRMRGLDVLFQTNRPHDPHPFRYLCSGFMVICCSDAARDFFARARKTLEQADDPRVGDQISCIRVLERDSHAIRFGLLPRRYWVPERTGSRWVPGVTLDPPADIILHHANYTVGSTNKLAQLMAVEDIIRRAKGRSD